MDGDCRDRDDEEPMNPIADYVYQQDLTHPDRPCAWCRNPRNSDQCGFGTSEIHHYQERFA